MVLLNPSPGPAGGSPNMADAGGSGAADSVGATENMSGTASAGGGCVACVAASSPNANPPPETSCATDVPGTAHLSSGVGCSMPSGASDHVPGGFQKGVSESVQCVVVPLTSSSLLKSYTFCQLLTAGSRLADANCCLSPLYATSHSENATSEESSTIGSVWQCRLKWQAWHSRVRSCRTTAHTLRLEQSRKNADPSTGPSMMVQSTQSSICTCAVKSRR
mmetsp:Transcript_1187/g.2641  ORF Transcript_1187/g.2641 Transcript_1187/m.2641 type:complete len:220 (+) Transcript_1187:476-1135(+)